MRYVDESAERDVRNKGGFENGMSRELAQELGSNMFPASMWRAPALSTTLPWADPDIPDRQYAWTVDQLTEKLHLDKQVLIDAIVEYDNYVMGVTKALPVEKLAIQGLYAAGEVTGGFRAGNRLGGNAVTEIIVSGRTAAQTIAADGKEKGKARGGVFQTPPLLPCPRLRTVV